MSEYWQMWERIHALPAEGVNWWLDRTRRCRGEVVDFHGLRVLDHDLHESLGNYTD